MGPKLSLTTPKTKETDETLHIYPEETVFSRTEWKSLRSGSLKNAEPKERLAARKVWESKFSISQRVKPGPKVSGPSDVARQTRQHYLWLFRQILGREETELISDVKVCERVAIAVFNYYIQRKSGLFVPIGAQARLRDLVFRLSRQTLGDEGHYILHVLKNEVRTLRAIDWQKLQEGRVSFEKTENAEPISLFVNSVFPALLGMDGDVFKIFQDVSTRLRNSSAGRPPRANLDRRILLQTSLGSVKLCKPTAPSSGERKKTKANVSTASAVDLPANSSAVIGAEPQLDYRLLEATETEILQRVVSELLSAKNRYHGCLYLEVSQKLAGWVVVANDFGFNTSIDYPEPVEWGSNLQEALEFLGELGSVQRSTPWDYYLNPGDLSYDVDIQPFGTFG